MKKLLLLVHASAMAYAALPFALALAQKSKSSITMLLLQKGRGKSKPPAAEHDGIVAACAAAGVPCHFRHIFAAHLDAVTDETAFADTIVCDSHFDERFFSMNSFISGAHCPVFVAPPQQPLFKKILFTYDGMPSSLHAIKQFTYLLPWCAALPVYLVSVLPENIRHVEYETQVEGWLKLHYAAAEMVLLKGRLQGELEQFISAQPNSIVVLGAFGRSALSRWFKESLATTLLQQTSAPLFITHA